MAETGVIAVFGATGAQGGSVVEALQRRGELVVRALTRNPGRAQGLGDEVVAADLDDPASLAAALDGVDGAFLNTNSFAAPDTDEVAQATAAIRAAREAGVRHLVWSTLPNVDEISGGRYSVPHFTNKASVNDVVLRAGFDFATFVEPPFYYQNLTSPLYPAHPGADGTPTWSQPMRADARGIHMGDIDEYGNLVAGVFERPEEVGAGATLSFAGDLMSWNDIVAALNELGRDLAYEQTVDDPWGLRDMFGYFEEFTYFGPDADAKISRAKEISTAPFTDFVSWAAKNMA